MRTLISIFIYSIIPVITFLLLAKTKVNFNPFSISFGSWRYALGVVLILIGISLIKHQGLIDGKNLVFDAIDEYFKNK